MTDGTTQFEVELEGGVRVAWDAETLAALSSSPPDASPEPAWRLDGTPPDWKRWSSMTILSAAFADGALVAFAALRPRKAKGHDEDRAASFLVREGAPHRFADFLISMQRDGAGELRRVNVEAYLDEDGAPLRLSGDVIARERPADSREVNVLDARLSGSSGFGTVEVLGPA